MAAVTTNLSADKTPLTDDDRFHVIDALMPVANKWKHIGTALGLQSATLEVIKDSHGGDTTEAVSQVVSKWLAMTHNVERFGEPCWDTLVKAVAHQAGGGDRRVADDIAKQYPAAPQPPAPARSGSTGATVGPLSRELYSRGEGRGLAEFPWFHGRLSREDCEQRMNSHGNNCFLIRESVRRESELTLSLKYESNIQHFMIKRGVGWVEVDGTFKQFYTIPDLVEYYRENSLTLKPKDQLSTPCPRPNSS